MPLMFPAVALHIALSNRPIHHSAIPLSTTTDANRQLRRKLNTEETDIGKTLMKAGMKMAAVAPSTMGTLM